MSDLVYLKAGNYSTFGVLCQNETTVNENINNNPEYSIKIQSSQYNLDAFLEKEENPFTFRNLTPNTKALAGSPDAIWMASSFGG